MQMQERRRLCVYNAHNVCSEAPAQIPQPLGQTAPSWHSSLGGTQSWLTPIRAGRGEGPHLPHRPSAPQAAVLIETWAPVHSRCLIKRKTLQEITFSSRLGVSVPNCSEPTDVSRPRGPTQTRQLQCSARAARQCRRPAAGAETPPSPPKTVRVPPSNGL